MIAADQVFQADVEGFIWLFILVAAGVFNLIKKGMAQANRSAPPVRPPGSPTSPSSGPPPMPGAGQSAPPVQRSGSENIQEYFERLQREFQQKVAPAVSPARAARAKRPVPPPPPPPPPAPRRPQVEEDVSLPVHVPRPHAPIGNPLSMGRAGASLSARDQARSIRCGAEALRMPMYGLQMQVDSATRGAPAGKPRLRSRHDLQRAVVSGIILGPPRGLCNTETEFRTRIGAP